jgi:putative membrane protein
MKVDRRLYVLLLIFLLAWIITFIGTHNRSNWLMENALVAGFVAILIVTYPRFQFSFTAYLLMLTFLLLHAYGAEFTYSKNPFGFWLKEVLGTVRNPYDRLVHFSFGLLICLPAYELFVANHSLRGWLPYWFPIMIITGLSGLSEIFEWMMTDWFFPLHGQTYLAAQGDPWDAQKDMAMASLGVVLASCIIYLTKRTHSDR